MNKVEKKELNFRGKKITRTIYHHCLGRNIVKINNVWFKVDGDNVTEDYIPYDKKLYVLASPSKEDLRKLGIEE